MELSGQATQSGTWSMRRPLWWPLCAAVVLSGVALWMPEEEASPASAPARGPGGNEATHAARTETAGSTAALPARGWPAQAGDPFRTTPAAPPAPEPAPAVAAQAPAPAPPPPAPVLSQVPVPDYRYLGRLAAPDGRLRLYVAGGELHHELQPGVMLPDGFVVDSLGPTAVRLRHPASGTLAEIPLPPTPEAAP